MAFNSKYSAKKYLNADELNRSGTNHENDDDTLAASSSTSDNDEENTVNLQNESEKRVSELNALFNTQKELYRKMQSQNKEQTLYKDDDDEGDEYNDDDDDDGDDNDDESDGDKFEAPKQSSGSTLVNEDEADDERQQLLKEFKENLKFKKYLSDLKKTYLENLSLSCPSKISLKSNSQTSFASRSDKGSTKRKILFENASTHSKQEMCINRSNGDEDDDEDDEGASLSLRQNLVRKSVAESSANEMLSTEQILSRLQQIREYLKQAYSMLGTLETSSDTVSYSAQMHKLNSLIDHLKEQEKGYMDLLNSLRLYEKLNRDESGAERHRSSNSTLLSESDANSKSGSKKSGKKREESVSLSASLISDTITLDADARKQKMAFKSDMDEQERLLKSINQRREELRALEGRRKALEALKLEALQNEKELTGKIDAKKDNSFAMSKAKLESFQRRFAELAASEVAPKSEISVEAMQPLSSEDKKLLSDRLSELQAKKSAVDQLLLDLNRLKEGGGELVPKNETRTVALVKKQPQPDSDQEEKMKTLIENQSKLDKLYAMQTRLQQLKSIVGHFNEEKNLNSILQGYEKTENDDESETENEEETSERGYKQIFMKRQISKRYEEAPGPQIHIDDTEAAPPMLLDELKAQSQKQLNEHKRKLNNAKEKLRQLQGLITSIQNEPEEDGANDDEEKEAQNNSFKQQNVKNWPQQDSTLDLSLSYGNGGADTSSDRLWAQMKQQLQMREKLRGKKKELEEVIRSECDDFKRPKTQQHHQQQQENLDDLISLSNYGDGATATPSERDVFNASINDLKKQLHESSETFGSMLDNQRKLSALLERNLAALNNQTPAAPTPVPVPPPNDAFVNYHNQMQIQQLVFNLNAAYREIALQRNEINQLTSQMNTINAHVFDPRRSVASVAMQTTDSNVNVNNNAKKRDETETAHTYVDDFEEDSSAPRPVRTQSSTSSSSDSNGKNVVLEKNSEYLRKRLKQQQRLNAANSSSSSLRSAAASSKAPKSTSSVATFDQLRETIYSEVATLISQNETRPQYLLNLFRELQHLQTKNSRDQALKSIFNISSRQSTFVQSNDDSPKSVKTPKVSKGDEAPFASDALGDTVIYLQMSKGKSGINSALYTCSSNSSMVSVKERNKVPGALTEYQISHDVPLIVERAMSMLKYDKETLFDAQVMATLIGKILHVLKQQKQHYEYLRLYQSQLSSYLNEALQNYLQVPVDACKNEIFYDVQDILRNELTFYSITSGNKGGEGESGANKASVSSGSNIVVISSSRKTHAAPMGNYDDEDSDGYEITGSYDVAKAQKKADEDYEDNLIKLAEQLSYEDDDDEDEEEEDGDELGDENGGVGADGCFKRVDEVEAARNSAGSMRLNELIGRNETIDLGRYERYQNEQVKSAMAMASASSAFIELAPSEIKPYSRIGSDEDENEQDDDDSQLSDNLETAVSRQPDVNTQGQPRADGGDDGEITIEDLPKNFEFTNLFGDVDNQDAKEANEMLTMENILLQSIADNIVDQHEYPGPMFSHRNDASGAESNEEIDKLNSEFIKLISSHINDVSREGKQGGDEDDADGDNEDVNQIDRNSSEA